MEKETKTSVGGGVRGRGEKVRHGNMIEKKCLSHILLLFQQPLLTQWTQQQV